MSDLVIETEFDVVVVGSGAAGMAAALTARAEGLAVLLVEKTDRIGGSTAISGGAIWVPLNDQSAAAGHPDTWDAVWTYLRHAVGGAASETQRSTFLRAGPRALTYLRERAGLQLAARTYSPDYHPDLPGAAMGGRSLDPLAFDGRTLGARFADLRDPLPEFCVLGGMMVTMTDVRHLLAATRSFPSWKQAMRLVLRYGADRLSGRHRGTRLVLGNALAGRLFKSVLDAGIPYWLNAPATELLHEAAVNARVTGVVVLRDGRPIHVRARRGVVLATGGFPCSEPMRATHYPQPTGPYSMSPEGNRGEGITLAQSVGAAWGEGGTGVALWAPVSLLLREDGSTLRYPHLVWDRAKPGLIAVNSAGQRFVNESTSYHEFVRGMYAAHLRSPSIPAWLVADSDFVEKWGLGLALPGGRPRSHLERAGYLFKAHSLAELAQRAGIDPAGLQATVATYNDSAQRGQDPAFGKGSTAYNRYLGDAEHAPNPCIAPLARAPFYAVQVWPGDIGTAKGIRIDDFARAMDAHDQPIVGLYVAGNDAHSVMGGEYPAPGITLGPALTFGWLAGMHLAHGDAFIQEEFA